MACNVISATHRLVQKRFGRIQYDHQVQGKNACLIARKAHQGRPSIFTFSGEHPQAIKAEFHIIKKEEEKNAKMFLIFDLSTHESKKKKL